MSLRSIFSSSLTTIIKVIREMIEDCLEFQEELGAFYEKGLDSGISKIKKIKPKKKKKKNREEKQKRKVKENRRKAK